MIDVSKHITMKEATHSEIATVHGISNIPAVMKIAAMQHVAQTVFEPLRAHFNVPIKVNSFYRSSKLNKLIGGSVTSQHVKGEAMDITGIGIHNSILFRWVKNNLPFDQLIWEMGNETDPEWIHISLTKGKNRYMVLKAHKNSSGKTMYEDITKTYR